jgi:hypothetical protein
LPVGRAQCILDIRQQQRDGNGGSGRMAKKGPRGEGQSTPLEQVPLLTARQRSCFAALRIETVEDLLALAQTSEDRRRLATCVGLSAGESEALWRAARFLADPSGSERCAGSTEAPLPDPPENQTRPVAKHQKGPAKQPIALKALRPQPLSAQQLMSLSSIGLTTAEELVAMGAVPANRRRLAALLDVTPDELATLLAGVRALLAPGVAAEMEKPIPGGPRHGVLDPIPEAKRRGRRRPPEGGEK